jgi:hypothetical protein
MEKNTPVGHKSENQWTLCQDERERRAGTIQEFLSVSNKIGKIHTSIDISFTTHSHFLYYIYKTRLNFINCKSVYHNNLWYYQENV